MSQQNPGFSGPNQQSGQRFTGQQPGQPMPNGPYQQYQGPAFQPPRKPKKSIWKRWWMICFYVIVGAIVASHLGGGGDDNASSGAAGGSESASAAAGSGAAKAADKANAQAPSKKAEPTKEEPKKAGIGTAVKSGDLTFTVTGFRCGVTVSDPMEQLTPQGQFCKLSVTIANGGKGQATVDDSQIKISDAKGSEYSTSTDTWAVDGSIFLKKINPGNKMSGVAYFDVPKGTTPTTSTFKSSLFSGTAEVALS